MGISQFVINAGPELNKEEVVDRFQFRKLLVYQKALDAAVAARAIGQRIPRESMDLRWQLQRAVRSVVLNVAEGAGEFSPKEKARLYRIARRSGCETIGTFDLGIREGFFAADDVKEAAGLLHEVTAILTTMVKRAETRIPRQGEGK
jgi:four helix bundle protein